MALQVKVLLKSGPSISGVRLLALSRVAFNAGRDNPNRWAKGRPSAPLFQVFVIPIHGCLPPTTVQPSRDSFLWHPLVAGPVIFGSITGLTDHCKLAAVTGARRHCVNCRIRSLVQSILGCPLTGGFALADHLVHIVRVTILARRGGSLPTALTSAWPHHSRVILCCHYPCRLF